MTQNKHRCPWVNPENPLYVEYHDHEWGVPVHDDHHLFEMLTLEGAQAGLSWETILKKRDNYRKAFAGFDPVKVARFTKEKQEKLMQDPGIVRNRLKIESTIINAKAFLKVQKEFGSFDAYLWAWVDEEPIINSFETLKDYPAKTELSGAISKDLLKRGFKFVGPTIIYAFMQAIGMVDDHTVDCFKRQKPWSLYMIKTKGNTFYTGIATDVAARLKQHQSQGPQCARYLRGKAPLELVFQQVIGTRSDALKAEYRVKQLTLAEKKKIIESQELIPLS